MKEITADEKLVSMCGLYCGACRAYLKGRCPGCRENTKASWCKVRSCCLDRKLGSCADCADFSDYDQCRKFNNVISRLFGLIFRSDRKAGILRIKAAGRAAFAAEMAETKRQAIRR